MKSFKSVVFSAIAALFLAVSLSGCLDGDKTVTLDSKQKPTNEAKSQDGKTFALPSGTSLVYVNYASEDVKYQLQNEMLQLFEENGIRVNTRTSYGAASMSALRLMEPLDQKKTLHVTMPGVKNIRAG